MKINTYFIIHNICFKTCKSFTKTHKEIKKVYQELTKNHIHSLYFCLNGTCKNIVTFWEEKSDLGFGLIWFDLRAVIYNFEK